MRVLVCGGRDYQDSDTVHAALEKLDTERRITMVIHGDARGADELADDWARDRQRKTGSVFDPEIRCCPAQWHKYGPRAGPIRNAEMLEQHRPELVVAFPGGEGTADMVRRAKAAGIEVREPPPRAALEGKA